jgi:hypothetical protein
MANAQGVFLWVKLVGDSLLAHDVEGLPEEDMLDFLRSCIEKWLPQCDSDTVDCMGREGVQWCTLRLLEAQGDQNEVVRLLIEGGIDINSNEIAYGKSLLSFAARPWMGESSAAAIEYEHPP